MESLFFQDAAGLLRTAVVGVLAYVGLLLLLRISGKRTLSKMNAFDLVVTIALGSTLATILLNKEVALAEGMLALAIEQKKLAPGQPIIEAVSGPFATALTLAGLTAGHPVVLVMPEDAPALRQENLLRLGAQIQHSPARSGLAGARAMAAQTAAANGWYYTDWLANDNNPEYHRRVTGPAILQNIAREGASLVDAITVGVGSAGTVTGVGETIKAWTNDVRIVAVEPFECQALTGGVTGPHNIPDIGFGLVPKNFNSYVVDNVAAVSSKDAQRAAQQVLRTDAIPASASAGAALHAAAKLVANGISRSALAVFSGRQNLL